MIKYDANLYL